MRYFSHIAKTAFQIQVLNNALWELSGVLHCFLMYDRIKSPWLWTPDYWTFLYIKTASIPNVSRLNPSQTPSLSSERYKSKESIFTKLLSERGVWGKGALVAAAMLNYTCLLDRSRGWRVIWECPMAQWSSRFCLRERTINNSAGQR